MSKKITLFETALKIMENAYAPYSKFSVGAAILSSNGNIYSGCNVENISYPCGTCAEQGAISAMVAGGDAEISEILIIGKGSNLITHCGACRQRIAEFGTPETIIHLANKNGIQKSLPLKELLPLAFQDKDLTK